ncbi:MAG: putative quinol monooxygenase [Desulfobacteraceae bacterium]|nr:putative quinol monooxygenase [Desulfobacteraceae bacterium]
MITVIAKLTIQEGKTEETITLLKKMMEKVAAEPGTLLYSLSRKPSDPNTLVIVERYKDKEALGAHSSTPHFKEFSAKLATVLAGRPDIAVMDELEVVVR